MEDRPQPKDQADKDRRTGDTAEYSASKSPDTRQAATQKEQSGDPRLLPGGAHRAAAEIGMSELNREDLPNRAERTGLVHGETEEGEHL